MFGSVGLGHKVIAENIAQALSKYPDIELSMLDVLEMYKGPLTETSAKIYTWIIKQMPALWRFFYTNRVFLELTLPLRVPFAGIRAKKLWQKISQEKPDLIVTTHPTPTAFVSYFKKEGLFGGLLITTFSDYHFQPYWVYSLVDRYLVMTEAQKEEVMKYGFSSKRIVVTGMPVSEEFRKDYEESEIMRGFKLSHTRPIILMMGGSHGWGIRIEDVLELLKSELETELVVVTGTDKVLAKKLESLAEKHLKVFSDWSNENIAKLFSVARILITKPGGLTVSQAIAENLPMILAHPLPAMEELNQDYLLKAGVAVAAKSPREIRMWMQRLLLDKKFYQMLKQNLKRINVPDAAERAASAIIDML